MHHRNSTVMFLITFQLMLRSTCNIILSKDLLCHFRKATCRTTNVSSLTSGDKRKVSFESIRKLLLRLVPKYLLLNLCLLFVFFPDDSEGLDPEKFDDVMDFIEATIGRLRRSSESDGGSRGRRERRQRGAANTDGSRGEGKSNGDRRRSRGRAGSRGGKGGRGERGRERLSVQSRGCLLKEVHLNVTDLGLGYQTKEELIFRYCSGPCVEAETNYDKILNNLTHNKKLDKDTPSRTCCRPIAFDDDLSFLDDNVVYHTLKKHSARKCGCV